MKNRERDKRKPVTKVVHEILDQARLARGDGPASSIYRRETQMSVAMTRAGTTLAAVWKAAKKASRSQRIFMLWAPVPRARPAVRRERRATLRLVRE